MLFAREAKDRLTHLAELILELEAAVPGPTDQDLVASIFREAHTIKGGAAMVELDHVAAAAHALEDLLEGFRSGKRVVTSATIDILLATADTLGTLVSAAVRGEDHEVVAAELQAMLRSALTDEPAAAPGVAASVAPTIRPQPERAEREHDAAPPKPEDETIQVSVARIDQLVRLVGESAAAQLRIGRLITSQLDREPDSIGEFRDLARTLDELQEVTMRTRMVPVRTAMPALKRALRDVARQTGKDARWESEGDDTELDRRVLEQLAEALMHLVRNSVDHGVETPETRVAAGKPAQATVRLDARQLGSEVILTLSDDGHGIDIDRVRAQAARRGVDTSTMSDEDAMYLIFRSGMSTAATVSDISGRGVGLDVVRTQVELVRGRIELNSTPGVGTEFRLIVPITLAILPCLVVEAGGRPYALPLHAIITSLPPGSGRDTHAEGRDTVVIGAKPIAVSSLAQTLGDSDGVDGPVVVVAGLTRSHAFIVDRLVGQHGVVVKGLGGVVPHLSVVAGASIEPDGAILLVLDVGGLISRARNVRRRPLPSSASTQPAAVAAVSVLVVDDALTVRELERTILEQAGYAVRTAGDGAEALAMLAQHPSDIVLTDVDMPRMDGLALTRAIRSHPTLANIPVLILTSRATEEDHRKGLDAGADGYIVKSAFDQSSLLAAVERVLGTAR